jgi:protein-tyrosine phosphatase
MRLYKMLDNLYVSGVPKSPEDVKDITAIVTMSKKMPGNDVLQNKKHFYCPIPDGKTLPDFSKAVEIVERWIQFNDTVLVHCLQGRNRSMMVAALVWRNHWKSSGEQAFQAAIALRPHCLHNPLFEEYLRSLP